MHHTARHSLCVALGNQNFFLQLTQKMAFSCFAPPKSKLSDGAHACLTAVVERVGELFRGPAKCLLINDAGELE